MYKVKVAVPRESNSGFLTIIIIVRKIIVQRVRKIIVDCRLRNIIQCVNLAMRMMFDHYAFNVACYSKSCYIY